MTPPADVSVVIPTYNRRALVAEAIDSVRRQTVPAREVIVVDDHSDDGTIDWLHTLPDVVATTSEVAHNRAVSRNTGLGLARGALVFFLDDDDVLEPTALERLTDGLRREPASAAVIGGMRKVGPWTPAGGERALNARWRSSGRLWREVLACWTPAASGQTLYRRADLISIGGFDRECDLVEDLDLLLRFTYAFRVTVVPDVVLTYRHHGGNVSAQAGERRAGLDRELRRRFVDGLPADTADAGRRAVRAGELLLSAMAARRAGRHGAALTDIAAAVSAAPWVLRSSVCAPLVARLSVVSALRLPTRSS